MNDDRSLRRTLLTLLLAAALLAPTTVSAVQTSLVEPEETGSLVGADAKRVDVLYTDDADPSYVADQLETFADDAGLDFRLTEVDRGAELLDAVRGSRADLLVVVGHGATNTPGPGSGVVVGDARITPGALVAAIADSAAERVYVAVCGLGLPDTIDGRRVDSYDTPIDRTVATLSILAVAAETYDPVTRASLGASVNERIEAMGGPATVLARLLRPQDTLSHGEYNESCATHPETGEEICMHDACFASRTCNPSSEYWERDLCERRHFRRTACREPDEGFYYDADYEEERWAVEHIQHDSYWDAVLGPDWPRYNQDVTENEPWFDFDEDVTYRGTRYSRLLHISWEDCVTLVSIKDLVVPGVTRVQAQMNQLPGWTTKVNLFGVEVCGELFIGYPDDNGNGEADEDETRRVGGTVTIQGGTHGRLNLRALFDDGEWFDVGAFLGSKLPITVSMERHKDHPDHDTLRFYIDLKAGLEVRLNDHVGWAGLTFGRWTPSYHIDWTKVDSGDGGTASQGSTTSQASPIQLQSLTRTLTAGQLRYYDHHPEEAEELSGALGRDVTELSAPVTVDLGDCDVYRALHGDGSCPETMDSKSPAPAADTGGPLARSTSTDDPSASTSPDRCNGRGAEASIPRNYKEAPLPGARARVCAGPPLTASTEVTTTGIPDKVEEETNGWEEFTPYRTCLGVGIGEYFCKPIRNGTGAATIFNDYGQFAVDTARLTVDVKKRNAAVFVNYCKTGICPEDAIGVDDGSLALPVGSDDLETLGLEVDLRSLPGHLSTKIAEVIDLAGRANVFHEIDCILDHFDHEGCQDQDELEV